MSEPCPTLSIAPEGPRLRITIRWWHPSQWRSWPRILYLLAFDGFLVFAARFILEIAESLLLFIPLGIFGGLPALMMHYSLAQRLLNRSHLTADADGIHLRWGPVGGGERTIELDGAHQFYAVDERGTSTVRLMRRDGESDVVARQLTPRAAVRIEQALEGFYRLADQPVMGELPRGEAFRAHVKRPWRGPLLHALTAVTLGGFFVWQMTLPAIGGVLGEVDLTEGDAAEVAVDLDEPMRVDVWVKLEVTFAGQISSRGNYVDQLSRGYDLVVSFDGHETTCDPFDIDRIVSQGRLAGVTETTVSWFARIADCGEKLEAGPHRIDLSLKARGDRYQLDRFTVLVRK